MQSADYKYIDKAVRRTNEEFIQLFVKELEIARQKRRKS